MPNIKFARVTNYSGPYDEGTIYFDDSSNLLKVGLGGENFHIYSGVQSVSVNGNTLNFINELGNSISVTTPNMKVIEERITAIETTTGNINSILENVLNNQ